jgi:ketosteroid isomerase-like protein
MWACELWVAAMSSVDLVAIAVDWLDAYRAGDLFIIDFYDIDASLQCDCGGKKEMRGTHAIAAFWQQRLVQHPVGELIELRSDGGDVVMHFRDRVKLRKRHLRSILTGRFGIAAALH